MVAYSIGVLLLIKRLKKAYPDVTQPGTLTMLGHWINLNTWGLYFDFIKCNGAAYGY